MSYASTDDGGNFDSRGGIVHHLLLYVTGFAALFLLWSVAALVVGNTVFLPSPLQVFRTLYKMLLSGELGRDVAVSVARVLLGFATGACIGVMLGIATGLNRTLFQAAEPLIELFRSIPPYAMIPFALLAWGVGDSGKVFILAYATFFPVILNTVAAVRNVPARLIEAGQTLGVGRSFLIRHVIIPAVIPQVLVGLRLGFGAAWIALIAAEMIGSSRGLGFVIADAREILDSATVIGGMLVIGLIGYSSNQIFLAVEQWSRK